MTDTQLEKFEKIIGYEFRNKRLLERALTHSSYCNEIKRLKKKFTNICYCSALRVLTPFLPACSPALNAAVDMLFAGTRLQLANNVTVHNEPKDGS